MYHYNIDSSYYMYHYNIDRYTRGNVPQTIPADCLDSWPTVVEEQILVISLVNLHTTTLDNPLQTRPYRRILSDYWLRVTNSLP